MRRTPSYTLLSSLVLLQIIGASFNDHGGIISFTNATPLTGPSLTPRQENVTIERPNNLHWECGWKDHDSLICEGLGEWSGEDRVFRRCEVILESGGVRNICEGYRICYVQNSVEKVCSEWPEDYCRVPEEIVVSEKVRRAVVDASDFVGGRGPLFDRAIAVDTCKVYTRGKRP